MDLDSDLAESFGRRELSDDEALLRIVAATVRGRLAAEGVGLTSFTSWCA